VVMGSVTGYKPDKIVDNVVTAWEIESK
jgi:hypothetical protein